MFKKLDPKVNLSLTLAIISGICAILLVLVNNITSPIIDKNTVEKKLALYEELFPEITDSELITTDGEPAVITAYKDTELLGVICSVSGSNGYGNVTSLVGINTEKKIVGVQFPKYNQTPGFGDKVSNQKYIKSEYIEDSTSSVDATYASGATYSSKLVLSLVQTCATEINEIDFAEFTTTDEDVISPETTVTEEKEEEE